MNDIMENVKGYLSAGNTLLRGKRLMVYLCLFIITIASMIPSAIKLAMNPDVKTVLPDLARSAIEMVDPYIEGPSKRSSQSQEQEFKSEGQKLAEKLQAEREASRKAAMKYVGILVDWVYFFLIGGMLNVGMCSIYLRLSKREVGVKDLFSGFTSGNYLNKVVALVLKQGIIYTFVAVEYLVLLFLPIGGLLVSLAFWVLAMMISYALFMVEFILADDPNISFLRAIEISIKASSGYKLTLLVIDLFTDVIPRLVASFVVAFLATSSILESDASKFLQALGVAFGLAFFLMLIKPIKDGAFAAAYEDAKMTGKSYGIISQFEFFDPEDQIDNTDDGGMIFFG